MLSDKELFLAAQKGDATSLGILLERYRPRLYALALRLLGYGFRAEDAVQETFLVALCKLHQVREPAAIGAWLHTVLKNTCRMYRRSDRESLPVEKLAESVWDHQIAESFEHHLDHLALRDWVWTALATLPETLRVTAMLRYFSRYNSYDEIARLLGIPVGTVRSRLSQAKIKLAGKLLETAAVTDSTARQLAESRADYYTEAWNKLYQGERDRFLALYEDDLLLVLSGDKMAQGRSRWAQEVNDYLASGARFYPEPVMASSDITIIEGRLEEPLDKPFHCPPGVTFVHFHHGDKTCRLHQHFAPRLPLIMT